MEVLHSDALNIVPSLEDVMMDNLNAAEIAEKHRTKLELAYRIMDRLSEKQRRRYVQYHALGLTLRQIANAEGITHKVIHKSIIFAIMADNMELFKQFQDNPAFRKWLSDLVFSTTYNKEGRSLEDEAIS